jgi:hypothetical protein
MPDQKREPLDRPIDADVFSLTTGDLMDSFDDPGEAIEFARQAADREPGCSVGVVVIRDGEVIDGMWVDSPASAVAATG